MLDEGHDTGLKRYPPLSILRDSESLVMVASEWGSTLPQLLLCPRGRWPCEEQEEKLRQTAGPMVLLDMVTSLIPSSYLSAEGSEGRSLHPVC